METPPRFGHAMPFVDGPHGEALGRPGDFCDKAQVLHEPAPAPNDPGRTTMDELITRLVAATGISADVATQATGIILAFLEKEGPASEVAKLVDALKGGREAVNAALNAEGNGGGLMGMLGGMMGGMGGGIAGLGGQLMGIGLDLGQMQTLGKELFAFAAEKAGPDVVGKIVSEVPGLSQFV